MNTRKPEYAIAAQAISKRYAGTKGVVALDGFDLQVRSGTVCGLLGPNGAGKSTAIKILATLLRADDGKAWVAGYDIRTEGRQVRQNIGLVGQYAAVDEILTGRQNLTMFGQLNHLSHREAQKRADALLEQFNLLEAKDRAVSKYSGGMRRRLDLAASLIVSPPVLFVDEPTTGLDPVGRREVWASIRSLATGGATVLLTTQDLEEADQLADRITMLKDGRVIAEGTPDALKSALGSDWLDIAFGPDSDLDAVTRIMQGVASGEAVVDRDAMRVSIPVNDRARALFAIATALYDAQIEPEDISLRRPNLDEVFIHLAGSSATHATDKEVIA